MEYLELPFERCKNCNWFDPSSTRKYDKCHVQSDCPAFEVQLVIRDSVTDLVKRYKQSLKTKDLTTQLEIITKVKRNKALEYKFKQELGK